MKLEFGEPYQAESVKYGDCCGEFVTKFMRSAGADLPGENLGVQIPEHLAEKHGTPVITKEQITPDLLKSMGPGTVIAFNRRPGDVNYKPEWNTHAEVTAINPFNGELMVASKTAGRGVRYKAINENYINSLGYDAKANNPFMAGLEKISNFLGPSSANAAEPGAQPGIKLEFGEPVKLDFGDPVKPKEEEPKSTSTKLGETANALLFDEMGVVPRWFTPEALKEFGSPSKKKVAETIGTGAELGGMALGERYGGPVIGGLGYAIGRQARYGAEYLAGEREGPQSVRDLTETFGKDYATGFGMAVGSKLLSNLGGPVIEWMKTKAAPKIYESAMKIPPSVDKDIRERAINTAIDGNYSITKSGLEKLAQEKESLYKQVTNMIDDAASQGKTVSTKNVLSRFDDLKKYYADMADPRPFWTVIDEAKQNILNYRGKTIPVDVAQKMKEKTYNQLKKAYGEMKDVNRETDKALARGLKEELENVIPELKDINKQISDRINLEALLTRSVHRIRNYELVRLGDMMIGVGGAAGTGSIEGGFKAALINHVLNNPAVMSRLALAFNKTPGLAGKGIPEIMSYSISRAMMNNETNKESTE
jgi:hypothetical protein